MAADGGTMANDFEDALAATERDARATQRAAEVTTKAAKRAVAAAVTGDVNAIGKALAETEEAAAALATQLRNTVECWSFDWQSYTERGGFEEELQAAARSEGLSIHEQDGRLFCYPALLRVLPGEAAVEIDRKRFRTIRPSYIARQLKALRTRRQRFKPEQFLEVLFKAYEWARKSEAGAARRLDRQGPVIELVSLLDLLTLHPDTRKEYGRAEFTRDLYLLDRSRVLETRSGARLELSASTGTKGAASRLLQIVGEDGVPKVYYGISFTGART
jgi:hypothetical protein